MKEVTFKSVALYVFGISLLILLSGWLRSPFALALNCIAFSFMLIGLLCGIVAFYRKSSKLRLITAHMATISIFYISWTLKMWDIAVGLSWSFVLISLAGVVYMALLPVIDRKLSEVLYREQMAPTTKIGRWIYRILLAVGPAAGVIGAAFGLNSGDIYQDKQMLVVLSFMFYLLALLMAFLVTYSYSHGTMEWKLGRIRKGKAS